MTAPFRCSDAARDAGLDPVGTAGDYTDFLLVEHPLPWPHDAKEVLKVKAPKPRSARVQLVVPPDGEVGSRRRVVLWRREPVGPFAGFRCAEMAVDPDDVRAAAEALLAGEVAPADDAVRDVLLCTHGNRDRCCGRLGILALAALGPDLPADVRLWRTSHTGGHRFAPTGITFPDGAFWAYLDDGALAAVIERRGDIDLRGHFRGSAGFESPAAQALDREAFTRFGWDWLATPRTATVDGDEVALHAEGRTVRGTVEVARHVPVPDCGEPPTGKEKRQRELRVARFEVTS